MKNSFVIVFLLFDLVNSYAQLQDPIKNYPGIPIIIYNGCVARDSQGEYIPPAQYDSLEKTGVFALNFPNLTVPDFNYYLNSKDFNLMMETTKQNVVRHIYRYTEARYTVFEAEGTPPEDGLVTLYHDSLDLDTANGYVSTRSNTPHGTMIYGPMYRQCRNYYAVDPGVIPYKASYILKIDNIDPWIVSSQDDTVCILQVTTTQTWDIINGVQVYTDFHEPYIVNETIVTYGLLESGIWDTIDVDYEFDLEVPWYRPDIPPNTMISRYNQASVENDLSGKISQNCVEFKVIWKGQPDRVKLSVDKIIVSDSRGRELKGQNQYQVVKGNIENQMDEELAFTEGRVVGFIGLDEPWSLDTWEPIRLVNEIVSEYVPLDGKHHELYYQFNVGATGRFAAFEDPALGSKINVIDEFMRRVKKANVWITGWLFDFPCNGTSTLSPCNQGLDYKLMNINILADSIYKKIANAGLTYPGLHYGMSVQNGQYGYYIKHDIREINRDELLYTTNLALLYGSKLLSPWIYFGWCNIPVPDPITGKWECYTGFSNYQDEFEVTDKYSTLKDTITPRLSGLMGITLRKLKPYKQFAGSNGIETLIQQTLPSDFDYINSIRSYGASTEYTFIELGFFSNPNDQAEKYFMPLNRYYSKLNNFTIGLRNLSGFKNWNLTYYEDNKFSNTIISNNGISSFAASIYPGDAKLFRLVPVLTHGGSLIADETVNGGTTLLADMTIENGVTLTVNDTYYANANITVKTGGKIIAGQNAKIIFANNKGLIIGENTQLYGTSAQIYGTPNNRLTLEFNSNTSTGVEIRFYYALTMSYCDIKNAFIGINAENASYINISNVNFTNCQYTGIVLFSFGNGDSNLSASSSTISNCIITGSSTGISVVNADELVIKENLINNCNLGIYLNQVNSSYIISNTILGWQSATGSPMPGISMSNGGGYLRNNTIRYHNYGVELVYSSPDMGVNTIENNYKCGLYISSGSYPNIYSITTINSFDST